MKKITLSVPISLVAFVMLACCSARALGADAQKYLQAVVARSAGALAMVRCEITDADGPRLITGQAVCIDSSGLMMTPALSRVKPETITKLELLAPGQPAKVVGARLLGIDAVTGLSFLQAGAGQTFTAISFMSKANLSLGQRVSSLCLRGDDVRLSPVLGTGFVAALQRLPGWLVLVTGGKLSSPGSVVFDSKGLAIGLVGAQPFLQYQTSSRAGATSIPLKSIDQTIAFTPAEEFVYVLGNIPQDGKVRRAPWLGIVRFTPAEPELLASLGVTTPGVMVGQVIPDSQADKMGIISRDIVVAVDGQPLSNFASKQMVAEAFMRQLAKKAPGQSVKLTILSRGQKRDVNIKLEPSPKRPGEAPRLLNKALGLLLREKVYLDEFLTKDSAAKVPGLLVMGVQKDSPAAKAGMRAGDVITTIDAQAVRTVDECKAAMEAATAQTPARNISLKIRRGDQGLDITVKPPETKTK